MVGDYISTSYGSDNLAHGVFATASRTDRPARAAAPFSTTARSRRAPSRPASPRRHRLRRRVPGAVLRQRRRGRQQPLERRRQQRRQAPRLTSGRWLPSRRAPPHANTVRRSRAMTARSGDVVGDSPSKSGRSRHGAGAINPRRAVPAGELAASAVGWNRAGGRRTAMREFRFLRLDGPAAGHRPISTATTASIRADVS